jgi:hypothetical protein
MCFLAARRFLPFPIERMDRCFVWSQDRLQGDDHPSLEFYVFFA